ncbi:hemin ABC transporter ATP-binding protein, partial [Streptomyces parvus]|nr:hemin ABC transporter ATP-binding protein [Streptomyces parvus]
MRTLRDLFAVRTRELPSPVAPGSPAVEAAGLSVRLGQRQVLDSVDLTAHAGEVV